MKDELVSQEETDVITGLYSKAAILNKLNDFLQENIECSIIVSDIDDLEDFCNNYGKLYGEFAISYFSDIVKNIEYECYVGRIVNDRFIILIKSADHEEIIGIIKYIQKQYIIFSRNNELEKNLTLSFGVARYPKCGDNIDILVEKANAAFRHVKRSGKNNYAFYIETEGENQGYLEDNSENLHITNEELLTMIKEAMNETKSSDKAIPFILYRVAKQFDLDKVSVIEYDIKAKSLYCQYQWTAAGIPSEKRQYLPYSKTAVQHLMDELDINGGKIIFDYMEKGETSDIFRFHLNQRGVKSAIHYKISNDNNIYYCLKYESHSKRRDWTPQEEKLLFNISIYIVKALCSKMTDGRTDEITDRLLNYDRLTKLFTLQRFIQEAHILRAEHPKEQFILAYCDFRNFKYINESFGYARGDNILSEFAGILREIHSGETGCVCRAMNDCFISMIMMKDGGIEEVSQIYYTVTNKIRELNKEVNLILDTGIYILNKDDDISVGIDNANYARRAVKETPNTGFRIFDDKMLEQLNIESLMLNSLDEAIKNGEFKVYYQPKVMLSERKIKGAEALVRWQKEGCDMVYPDQFIPFCENNGSIGKIDYYVLENVCKTIRRWLDNDIAPVCISVNLSRNDCIEEGFFDKILYVVEKYHIPHRYLEFEITESAFVENTDILNSFVRRLLDTGFEVSIDDFGSGYSSLNLLPDMPVSIIKLDREFWKSGKPENAGKRKFLLRKVIETIKLLDFKIICEGIEYPEQADSCLEMGCDMVQGYLFGKPMPIEEFEKYNITKYERGMV